MSTADVGMLAVRVLAPVLVILIVLPMLQWVERRGAGLIQDRPGPNRVGPFGLLQPLADVVKFFMKEDLIPSHADRFLYVLAPGLASPSYPCGRPLKASPHPSIPHSNVNHQFVASRYCHSGPWDFPPPLPLSPHPLSYQNCPRVHVQAKTVLE